LPIEKMDDEWCACRRCKKRAAGIEVKSASNYNEEE
jgi:hypothetical protein